MLGFLSDLMLFVKLFVFLLIVQWLSDFVKNRALFVAGLLILAYYIFFARWTILGTLIVGFVLITMGGIGNFLQDIIFQYDMVNPPMEEGNFLQRMGRP